MANYYIELGGGGGSTSFTIGTIDSVTPSANGLVFSGNVLTAQSASATVPGMVNTGTQTMAGAKTFTGAMTASSTLTVTDTLTANGALSATSTLAVTGVSTMTGIINANGGIDRSTAGTLTIGATNSSTINIGNAGATVNITGTTVFENATTVNVADALITVNKGGGAGSGQNAGIEIEEASSITGYMETSADRNSWIMKAPNTAGVVTVTPGSGGFTISQGSHNAVTLAAIGSSPNANGATLSTQQLNLEPASASFGGVVTTGTQTLAGAKTLQDATTCGGNGNVVQLTVKANASQSANLQNWSDSTPTVMTSIDSVGNLIFTGKGTSSIPLIKTPASDGNVGVTGRYIVDGQGVTERENGTDAFWFKKTGFHLNNGCPLVLHQTGATNNTSFFFGTEVGTGWYQPTSNQWAWAAGTGGGAGTQTLLLTKLASTFTGTLSVTGAADAKQMVVKGNATQTNNIIEVQKSDATVFFSIDNNAQVTIGNGTTAQHIINGATKTDGAQTGTLTNAPTAGNPAGYLKVTINGTTSYIPFWQ